jgi:hypothetical protein
MSELIVLDGGAGRELAGMGAPFRQPKWRDPNSSPGCTGAI